MLELIVPMLLAAMKTHGHQAAANIEYGSSDDYARAQEIAHAFEQAGWDYRLVAGSERPGLPRHAGVEVYGTDGDVVDGVANALSYAQVPDVRSWVIENQPQAMNPHYPQPVYIYVGHAAADQRSPAGRFSEWTTPSVLVGIAAVVVTYVVAAAPLHWWPF
jgi:hypothetical protein